MKRKITVFLTITSVIIGVVGCGTDQISETTSTESESIETVNIPEATDTEKPEEQVLVTESEQEEEIVDLVLEGERYLFGLDGYEQNTKLARNMFSFAINEDDRALDATAYLMYMYRNDMGIYDKMYDQTIKSYETRLKNANRAEAHYQEARVERNWDKMIELYTLMANESELDFFKAISMKKLGEMVEDKNEAAEWKSKAEELNVKQYVEKIDTSDDEELEGRQIASLASIYRNGKGVAKNPEKAFELYMQAADLGNDSAINTVGYMYEHGEGVAQDYQKAIEYYEKASEKGNTTATRNLAHMYRESLGVAKDATKAFEIYLQAANEFDAKAMNIVAYMYEHGEGVAKNKEEAIKWYTRAIHAGSDIAKDNLEYMNDNSPMHADFWFNKMREQKGHEDYETCVNVGYFYYNGITVDINYELAYKYFKKALEYNPDCIEALLGIGAMYYNGWVVEQDINKAIEYVKHAYEVTHDEEIKDILDYISS